MRKILFIFSLWLGLALLASAAETLTLTDGTTAAGDIVKFDDNGLLLREAGDVYVNLPWAKFSQEALKHLAENPKLKPLVEVFIEPDASQRPPKPEIKVNPVTRMQLPANPSLFGGLVKSPVGLFILLVLYVANLYAAFEVSAVRARSAAQVMGVSALLPIIGPIIFLVMPIKEEAPPEAVPGVGAAPAGTAGAAKKHDDIQIVDASWKQEEKKVESQIFARGKFTFNKRFVETKFAGYIGEAKGDALKFSMELKTSQGQFQIERIMQVAVTDVIFDTVNGGQITVPLADILEIKLNPKAA